MNNAPHNPLDTVLDDLAAESGVLDALVSVLDEQDWRRDTPAAGWDIATQIAHLAWTDDVAVLAATDKAGWDAAVMAAIENPEGYVDEQALELGRIAPTELLAHWRESRSRLVEVLRDYPRGEKLPWFGPPMSPTSMATARFMETWAHGLDVAEAMGRPMEPTDRIRHVAHIGVRTRNFAFGSHELTPPAEEFLVELTSPTGAVWQWGPSEATQGVSGSAYDFARLVTQRIHRDDTDLVSRGDDAEQWLRIAQCFAGPAGGGRGRQQ